MIDIASTKISEIPKETLISTDFAQSIFDTYADDEVGRQDYINEALQRAKELQVVSIFRNNIKLIDKQEKKRIKEEERKKAAERRNLPSDNVCTFEIDDEDIVFNTGRWIVSNDGVYTYDGFMNMVFACRYPICIVQRMRNKDTAREQVLIAWVKDGQKRSIPVPRGTLASASKIVSLADFGVPVTSENARHLINYFDEFENLNSAIIPEIISTCKCGWYKDLFVPYYENDIHFEPTASYKVLKDAIVGHGDFTLWLNTIKDIRKNGRIEPLIYLAASFGSVIPSRLDMLPFIVNLYGETGKGKTVSLKVAASIWGNPEGRGFISESNSTLNALEMKLDVLNNIPLMIDDLAKIQKEDSRKLTEMVYMLAAGGGKNRLTRELDMRYTSNWCNIILTNMERPITDDTMQGGAINRVLDFEMQDGYIFQNANEIVNILSKNYGYAGDLFTRIIAKHGNDYIKEMIEKYKEIIKKKAAEINEQKEEKQIAPLAILLTADEISEQEIFQDGIRLDLDYCVKSLKSIKEVSEMQRAYNSFSDAVTIHHLNFENNAFELWGKRNYTDHTVAIFPTKLNEIAQEYNFNSKQFISWCYANNLLICSDEKHKSKVVHFNVKEFGAEMSRRCYVIRLKDDEGNDDNGFVATSTNDDELPFDLPY